MSPRLVGPSLSRLTARAMMPAQWLRACGVIRLVLRAEVRASCSPSLLSRRLTLRLMANAMFLTSLSAPAPTIQASITPKTLTAIPSSLAASGGPALLPRCGRAWSGLFAREAAARAISIRGSIKWDHPARRTACATLPRRTTLITTPRAITPGMECRGSAPPPVMIKPPDGVPQTLPTS